ncbi:MAG: retroviral-like aspartic protease family protein [gamma proteobacterium symbiont of Lucinoma myriamae]|nr:retroviral-like aspartic protease family protein [gamma proteobacterium symbiont of Lucinoma myriamae]MCU7831757.1 retroviral-like aspartic protease family protein [gamma proteobacterium symbiont of Lucinoma myriamae]
MALSLISLILLLFSLDSFASHKIKVMALFTDKAMLVIDGSQKILKKGQTYKGVKLISSDSNAVFLELHGEKKKFKLGSEISTSFKKADPGKELVVWKDQYNMFRVHGSINKFSIHFLIDTGATSVAMSSVEARRMGLKYKKGTRMQSSTASGVANGYSLNLDEVKIGHIKLYNVRAVVLEGSFPTEVLLGQSFLSRVHMVRDGDKMKLRKKFCLVRKIHG